MPTLNALTLTAATMVENSAAGTIVGAVLGRTAGSALTLIDSAGGRFGLGNGNLVAGTVTTDFEAATTHSVTIREALAGYADRDTVLTVSVGNLFEQPALAALSLSALSFALGTAASGAVTGATPGSSIAATGLPAGLSIDGTARTWSWSGSGSAGSTTITLTETLADSANSPRSSSVAVSVAAAAPTTLPNFRSAMAAAQAGTAGPLVINVVGDSTVAGSGAGSGTPATLIVNNPRANAINQKLADSFAASGLIKNGADVFGFNFPANTQTAADYAAWNTSVTPGSWAYGGSALVALGGNMWNAQAAGANWSWTAEGRPFNQLVIHYVAFSAGGSFRVLIDGVAQSTVNTANATAGIGRVAFTPAVGTHIVELQWVSGSVYISSLETLDLTNKASVRIRNLGQGSATSTDLTDNSAVWRQRPMLAAIDAAHLHIIEGGVINDWVQSVPTSATSSNLATMMVAAQAKGGDVLLLGPTRSSPTATAAATQQAYVDAMAALANGTTRSFYDLKTGVGDYAAMSAAGRMFDNVHPNAAGYAAQAAALYAALIA